MKKVFTTILICSNLISIGQPTLLSTEMAAPGTVFIYKDIQTFTGIDTSIQGSNQTWDFTLITTSSNIHEILTVIDPTQTSYADSFPAANYGLKVDQDEFTFYNLTSNLMERVGAYNNQDGYIFYPNTQIEYIFPMAMGISNSDQVSTFNNGTVINGSLTIDCIGDGTLIIPGHTFSNVILTRVQQELPILPLFTYYIWYDSDNGMPVFDYTPGNGLLDEEAIYLESVSNNINKNNNPLSVHFNNPIISFFNMDIKYENPVEVSYTLINSFGELIVSGLLRKEKNQYLNLSFETLPSGFYLLSLTNNDDLQRKTFRLIKE